MISTLLILPKFAESLTEAKILEWKVPEGAPLRRGQAVALVETDKFTIDVEVELDCVLEEILAPAGAVLPVGAPMARLIPTGVGAPQGAGLSSWEGPVDLRAIEAHRARWRQAPPGLLAYLTVAAWRVVSERSAGLERLRGESGRAELGLLLSTPQGLRLEVLAGAQLDHILAAETALRQLPAIPAAPPTGAHGRLPLFIVGVGGPSLHGAQQLEIARTAALARLELTQPSQATLSVAAPAPLVVASTFGQRVRQALEAFEIAPRRP